jgi:hypothetical protein
MGYDIDPTAPVKKKRGPKPMTLEERARRASYKPVKARVRYVNEISIRRKIVLIEYFLHHRIHEPMVEQGLQGRRRTMEGLEWDGAWRPPTLKEAEAHFKVPASTIQHIWKQREEIVALKASGRKRLPSSKPRKKRLKKGEAAAAEPEAGNEQNGDGNAGANESGNGNTANSGDGEESENSEIDNSDDDDDDDDGDSDLDLEGMLRTELGAATDSHMTEAPAPAPAPAPASAPAPAPAAQAQAQPAS